MSRSRIAPALAAGCAALAILLQPAVAGAHVNATGTPAENGAVRVSFWFDHGCEGKPTTSLRIQLPEGTAGVTAEPVEGWSSNITRSELSWTGGSAPDGTRATFDAVMRIPGTAGETIYFPTLQGCDGAEHAWLDKNPDASAETAAPRIVLTQTVVPDAQTDPVEPGPTTTAPGSTTAAAPATTAAPVASTTAAGSATSAPPGTLVQATTASSSSAVPIVLGVVILLVVLMVVAALVSRNRRPAATNEE